MAEYRVEIKRRASKELDDLEPALGRKILALIDALSVDPRPRESRKLTRGEDSYRLRIGTYRVIYEVDDKARVVMVSAVRHRRAAYR